MTAINFQSEENVRTINLPSLNIIESRSTVTAASSVNELRLSDISCLQLLDDPFELQPPTLEVDTDEETLKLHEKRKQIQRSLDLVNRMIELRLLSKKRKREGLLDSQPRKRVNIASAVLNAPITYVKQEKQEFVVTRPFQTPFLKKERNFFPMSSSLQEQEQFLDEEPPFPNRILLAQPKKLTDKMLFGEGSNGKRNGMLVRCRLYCAHCRNYFYAKPTKRPPYYVLNHQCSGDRRKQFVLGRHHRRCNHSHPNWIPCIDFAPVLKPEQQTKPQFV